VKHCTHSQNALLSLQLWGADLDGPCFEFLQDVCWQHTSELVAGDSKCLRHLLQAVVLLRHFVDMNKKFQLQTHTEKSWSCLVAEFAKSS
jgi:hypothetical protein